MALARADGTGSLYPIIRLKASSCWIQSEAGLTPTPQCQRVHNKASRDSISTHFPFLSAGLTLDRTMGIIIVFRLLSPPAKVT
jgi:hypothetical protein